VGAALAVLATSASEPLTGTIRRPALLYCTDAPVEGGPDVPRHPAVDIRRAEDRFATDVGWLDSRRSFSFGHQHDPGNVHHGVLLVNNDDTVLAGTGFDAHPHRDMEIVTWLLRGSLVHQDSLGTSGIIYPGLAQRMSAGTGILHSESNDSWTVSGDQHDDPVHFIQMWVPPDTAGLTPGYEQLEIDTELLDGSLTTIATGMDRYADQSAIRIRDEHVALHVDRLQTGQSVEVPEAPWVHLLVARGTAELEGAGRLTECDAVRFSGTGGQSVTAMVSAVILVWEMHANIRT
jgi:redox-sensitive bicupin YhaK (pirin superfamily)